MLLPPSPSNGMQIAGANSTRLDLDIDIVVLKRLRLEVIELELAPVLRVLDLEALEGVGVNHLEVWEVRNESIK